MSEETINKDRKPTAIDFGKFILACIEDYGIDVFELNPTLLLDFDIKEEWKDIDGYKGYYQVSSFGRIRGCERNVTKLNVHTKQKENKTIKAAIKDIQVARTGYQMVSLYKNGIGKGYSVHRLVAKAFIPNYGNKPQVNHKDGIKRNNYIGNLEWATHSENMYHSCRVLKRKLPRSAFVEGANHVEAKPIIVFKNGKIVCVFTHSTECSENIIDDNGKKSSRTVIMNYSKRNKEYFGLVLKYISKVDYNNLKEKYPAKNIIVQRIQKLNRELSDSQVRNIRKLLHSGLNCRQIAEKFPVSETMISRIKLNKSYNHVK